MKEIPLSNAKGIAIVDDCDFNYLNSFKWHNSEGYAARKLFIDEKEVAIRMHREILDITDPKLKVDHINHNTLLNTRANLRVCRHDENLRNMLKKKMKVGGFKGVDFHRKNWRARIRVMCKEKHLGYFSSPKEAAAAYDKAAIECFGEFACLNFPNG